jgi:hypothetical protein
MIKTQTNGNVKYIWMGMGGGAVIGFAKGSVFRIGRSWFTPHNDNATTSRSKAMENTAKFVEKRRSIVF